MPTESRVPPSMRMRLLALSLLLACCSGAAAAQSGQKPTHADPTIDPALMRAGFLSGHPDLRFRLLGLDEFKQGKMEDAFKFFQRAAYYADKPSQGMVAEMLWSGQGVAQVFFSALVGAVNVISQRKASDSSHLMRSTTRPAHSA